MSALPAILELRAPAKVNLVLRVVGRRPDGFHELETVMQTLELADRLRLERRPGAGIELTTDVPWVPAGEENLVWRGARLFLAHTGLPGGVAIHLAKRVPAGGGLGGGSSDLAALLVGMNRLWGEPLTSVELGALAARLGSDTAFFVTGGRALCRGRGERVESLAGEPSFTFLLVMPPFPCPTGAVFDRLERGDFSKEDRFRRALDGMIESGADPRDWVFNDLEDAARRAVPGLDLFWRGLDAAGLEDFRLSGSGSTLFRLFREREEALELGRRAGSLLEGKAMVQLAEQAPGGHPFSSPER